MQKKEKATPTLIDTGEIIKNFENDCKESVQRFINSIAEAAPNRIDIKKFRASKIEKNKNLNEYESKGEITITPIGTKSVQIEAMDTSKSSKIYQPIFRFFMEEGYNVSESAGVLNISLKQVTEESRLKLVKEMGETKERYKREINEHRTNVNKKLKGLPENELASSEKEVEKIKAKYQKELETQYEQKQKEIIGNIKR
jgi:ribosome recycling factor